MFISITFTETSIDEANKTQLKVRGSKFMFKISTIHGNTCILTTTPLRNRCRYDGVHGQQPPLPQQTFFQLLHIIDPRAVDPLLKHTPDAVVHRIQIWRIRWPHLWRDKLWRLSLQHGDSCTMWRCSILLKKGSNPRKQSGYPAEAYSAELYSGNSHRWHPWLQEVQLRSTKTGDCHRNHQRLRSGVVVWMHVFAWMVDIVNINFEPLTLRCVLFVSSILVYDTILSCILCWVVLLRVVAWA